jgi:hypothetical protein
MGTRPTHRREEFSHSIADSPIRESFFDYEYLCEFEAKIGTDQNVVLGTNAEPIYAKTYLGKSASLPCPFNKYMRGLVSQDTTATRYRYHVPEPILLESQRNTVFSTCKPFTL